MISNERLAPIESLAGKCAVITGAASGLGRALVQLCGSEGMKVVAADVDTGRLRQLQENMRSGDDDVIAVDTDVRDGAQVQALAQRTADVFGAPYLVFNNAGVSLHKRAWEYDLRDWQWILDVNLWGVIHGVRTFLPLLIAQGEGQIVNTASMGGLRSTPGNAPYHVAKYGVVALSEAVQLDLAEEHSPVGLSVVCPGFVQTELRDAERNRPLRERSGHSFPVSRRASWCG